MDFQLDTTFPSFLWNMWIYLGQFVSGNDECKLWVISLKDNPFVLGQYFVSIPVSWFTVVPMT